MPFKNPALSEGNFSVEGFTVTGKVDGTGAATATNYGIFWTAPAKCVVDSAVERHRILGTNGGAVTLDIYKVPSGTAEGSGTAVTTGTVSLKTTNDTNQSFTISTTAASAELAAGDSLALIDAGTLTAVEDVLVTVGLHWIP